MISRVRRFRGWSCGGLCRVLATLRTDQPERRPTQSRTVCYAWRKWCSAVLGCTCAALYRVSGAGHARSLWHVVYGKGNFARAKQPRAFVARGGGQLLLLSSLTQVGMFKKLASKAARAALDKVAGDGQNDDRHRQGRDDEDDDNNDDDDLSTSSSGSSGDSSSEDSNDDLEDDSEESADEHRRGKKQKKKIKKKKSKEETGKHKRDTLVRTSCERERESE